MSSSKFLRFPSGCSWIASNFIIVNSFLQVGYLPITCRDYIIRMRLCCSPFRSMHMSMVQWQWLNIATVRGWWCDDVMKWWRDNNGVIEHRFIVMCNCTIVIELSYDRVIVIVGSRYSVIHRHRIIVIASSSSHHRVIAQLTQTQWCHGAMVN